MSDETTGPSSALASITAIANRIQEKANALKSEQNLLQDLQQQLQDLTKDHTSQCTQNDTLKYNLLKQVRSRHGVELELMRRQDCIKELQSKIDNYEKEIAFLQLERTRVKAEFFQDQEIYTPHLVKIELFQRQLEGDLGDRRERRLKRESELDSLILGRGRDLEEAKAMHREKERIETETEVMQQVEMREDEEIAALAMQIRSTLSKRTSLRSALEDARKRNEKANDTMIKWEEECMKLSNQRAF